MSIPESPFDDMSACLIGTPPSRVVKVNEYSITCLELSGQTETGTQYKILGYVTDFKVADKFLLGKKVKFKNIVLSKGVTDGEGDTEGEDSGDSGTRNSGRNGSTRP